MVNDFPQAFSAFLERHSYRVIGGLLGSPVQREGETPRLGECLGPLQSGKEGTGRALGSLRARGCGEEPTSER